MQRKINIHFFLIILAALMWGIAGIFVRSAQRMQLKEMELVLGRAAFSVVVLFLIMLFKDKSLFKIKPKDMWLFAAAGLFSIVLFNFSYYKTMSLTSLSVAAVLLYTAPFFVVVISTFLFKERMSINKLSACVIAFLGCCFVSGLFNSQHRISGEALGFGLLTGFGYALYTIFGELLLKRNYNSLTITFYVFLSATICCLPFVDIKGMYQVISAEPKAVYIVILMAVFNTIIPYICYTNGLKGVEPSVAPIIATLEPVMATVVGFVVFKEGLGIASIIGISLVLGSVVILNLKLIRIRANAKINLSLAILGKREDGYHLIDTVMQSVSLGDRLIIKKGKGIRVICSDDSVSEKDNICYKAAELYFNETKIKGGTVIKIKKNIPLAAGLGGGSADAAAVLLGLNKLYRTELSDKALYSLAEKLGADVPFFLLGGTVRAEGIGEHLTKLKDFEKGWFLLVKGDSKPSTKEMYSRLDSKPYITVDTLSVIEKIENNDMNGLCQCSQNSFTAIWESNATCERLNRLNSLGVKLSGSGPTWFCCFESKGSAKIAYRTLKREGYSCFLVRPQKSSVIFE